MTGVSSDDSSCSTCESLLSFYNTHSPKFFDKVGWLVLLNKGRPKNVVKLFAIDNQFALKWEDWDVADTLAEVRDKQLPVVLHSYFIYSMSDALYSQIKEFNVIGWDLWLYSHGIWTDQIKDTLLFILENKDPRVFIKLHQNFILRNFTKVKRQMLAEVLKTNQKIYGLRDFKFEFMDFIEIKN